MTQIYDFSATSIEGKPINLSDFKQKVLLIVNTASQCGFTPQYQGLQALHTKYSDRGLVVLGFPCNQFGQQEPGDSSQIQSFCAARFGVTFPLAQKVDVNGTNADPIYKYLVKAAPGIFGSESIKWNFTKFLIDRTGKAIRYSPLVKPEDLEKNIKALL